MIEFAMVIPIVALLFMGIFDFSRFFYTQLTLQHAIHEATRFAVTGGTLDDAQGNKMTRVESIRSVITREATALDLDVNRLVIDPADGGGPSEVVTVTGNFEFQFVTPGVSTFFPDGKYDFTVATAMKNEPFSGAP
ncbi:MAG: pilus assembly protein [Gemmatimonadota bacterium]